MKWRTKMLLRQHPVVILLIIILYKIILILIITIIIIDIASALSAIVLVFIICHSFKFLINLVEFYEVLQGQ